MGDQEISSNQSLILAGRLQKSFPLELWSYTIKLGIIVDEYKNTILDYGYRDVTTAMVEISVWEGFFLMRNGFTLHCSVRLAQSTIFFSYIFPFFFIMPFTRNLPYYAWTCPLCSSLVNVAVHCFFSHHSILHRFFFWLL